MQTGKNISEQNMDLELIDSSHFAGKRDLMGE